MLELYLRLVILFFVIIDPLLSVVFFITNTKGMTKDVKLLLSLKATLFALLISFAFLFFGKSALSLFSISLHHFQIAGGIILLILGIKMTLGLTFKNNIESTQSKDTLPTIIATPLLSGPACITTIMILSLEHGRFITGLAVSTVLVLSGLILVIASITRIERFNPTAVKMLSTLLGLITLSFGVSFIMTGLGL